MSAKGPGGTSRVYDLMAPAYEILASPERIAKELDALEPHLRGIGAQKILDAGCAAGFHSLELARRGFTVLGIDRVESMVREAERRAVAAASARTTGAAGGTGAAASAGATGGTRATGSAGAAGASFLVHDLREAHALREAPFDALLCLGNTISSVTAARERVATLRSFFRALRPGGLLVLQLRDLAAVRKSGHTFPVRALRRGAEEWILLRRHDPLPGKMRFLSFLLHRSAAGAPWELEVGESATVIEPPRAWREAVAAAGFTRVRLAADLAGTPRRGKGSGDLVIFARRA